MMCAGLIASAVHSDEQHVRPLARLVAEKTGGNPFFTIQFLTELAAEALLSFDAGIAAWNWNVARIGAKGYTDNIAQLMVAKLQRLPAAAQEALKELACLGNIADFATLAIVRESSEEEIHSAFRDAAQAGLVIRLEGAYRFAHDRVQEAAYALIPQALRPEMHLRIGRQLRAASDDGAHGRARLRRGQPTESCRRPDRGRRREDGAATAERPRRHEGEGRDRLWRCARLSGTSGGACCCRCLDAVLRRDARALSGSRRV